MDYSSPNSTASCRLLALSPEIRNRIYEFVVVDETMTVHINNRHKPPSLLRTCRKLRSEASSIYYGCNIFEVILGWKESYVHWLGALPAETRDLIATITIRGFDYFDHVPEHRKEAMVHRLEEYIAEAAVGGNFKLKVAEPAVDMSSIRALIEPCPASGSY